MPTGQSECQAQQMQMQMHDQKYQQRGLRKRALGCEPVESDRRSRLFRQHGQAMDSLLTD